MNPTNSSPPVEHIANGGVDANLLTVFLDQMPQMAWIRANDGSLYINQRLKDFFGERRPSIELEDWLKLIHPDDQANARDHWENFAKTFASYETRIRVRRDVDQSYRWLVIRVFAVHHASGAVSHVAGTMMDVDIIEHSVRRMETLQALASELSGALTQEDVAKIIVERGMAAMGANNGYYVMVSGEPAVKRLVYAYDMERYANTSFAEVAVLPGLPTYVACETGESLFLRSATEIVERFPKVTQYAKGPILEGFIALPLRVENKTAGVICFGYVGSVEFDADFKNFASAFAGQCAQSVERARAFDLERSARARIEAANRAKTSFVANMSHEFRTPLTAILGFAEFLIKDNLPIEKRLNYVDGIRRNGQALLKLVEDIMDLSRVEAGRIRLDLQPCSPKLIIEDVLEIFREEIKRKNLQLNVHDIGAAPMGFVTDPVRFRQILINLLGNAVKFTDQGQIDLGLKYHKDVSGNRLEITVGDTGQGVAFAQLDKLFQAFGQAESTTRQKVKGTGLGLFISRGLAQAMGGDLELTHSEIGVGSVFCLRLADLKGHVNTGTAENEDSTHAAEKFSGQSVLVVEDTDDLREFLVAHLTEAGCRVEFAVDGQDAIARAMSGSYDVVLMDIHMPVLDGFEAVKALRARGYRVPIVAVTARSQPEDRVNCFEVGFDAFLSKPINLRDLEKTLRRFFRRS